MSQACRLASLDMTHRMGPDRKMYRSFLTRQISAWKASWARLADGDEATRTSFLRKIGVALGEQDSPLAVGRAGVILGLDAESAGRKREER